MLNQRFVLVSCLAMLASWALPATPQNAPESDEEHLRYTINWPSGLSLGEGTMRARRLPDPPNAREYSLVLDAAIPGVIIRDEYTARATAGFCSLQFEKNSVHGPRKASEKSVFDFERNVLTRTTTGGGGKSEISTAPCAKDALTFIYFLRREVAQGRVPTSQTVYFGAAYQMRMAYANTQQVTAGGERVEADRFTAKVKGPASETSFEIWLSRDPARTPVMIRVPFAMGTFSMELVR